VPDRGLLLIGNFDPVHVGAHLRNAADVLGVRTTSLATDGAYHGNRLMRAVAWRLRGHRPLQLDAFSAAAVETCRVQRPSILITTGIAPVSREALADIGRLGITRINYLTDDPWNPAHAAPWFMEAMREYDQVFSTRRANLDELRRHGCRGVQHLPFAFAPEVHYPERPSPADGDQFNADVVFAGGADPDRVPLIASLVKDGFDVALYGGYWRQHAATRQAARGHADAQTLRKAVAGAKVALCLVRKANRDGSAMRTFEVAAMGACMLAEDTDEHREILGLDGEAVVYFGNPEEMRERLQWLLAHESERTRLAAAVRARVVGGRHRYEDRLRAMLAQTPVGAVA